MARSPVTAASLPLTEELRQHFSFFGKVASVAVSREYGELIRLLHSQRELNQRWRHLHAEHARHVNSVPSSSLQSSLPRGRTLLEMERTICSLVRLRAALRRLSTRAEGYPSTGQAFVTFERFEAADTAAAHFETIRNHERSSGGYGTAGSVDFRRQYFDGRKLEVTRACEPSDIIWENLGFPVARAIRGRVLSALLVFIVSCVSTVFIVVANVATTMHGGALTSLWSTPVIILSNVVIFALVPQLSTRLDRHHHRSTQHLHMLLKMAIFQWFNTSSTAVVFLFLNWQVDPADTGCPLAQGMPLAHGEECFDAAHTASYAFNPRCVRHWYTTGALALLNALIGDLTAILGLIELVRPDKLITRYILAPRAHSQAEMNDIWCLDSSLYLPFRYQLVLKVVLITFMFCPAIPLLLPFAALFMSFSYFIDKYNLMRVFKPPPRTTERSVAMSVLYLLPAAVFGHVWMALFFYSKQVGLDVPLLYYAVLLAFALLVLMRISSELHISRRRRVIAQDERQGAGDKLGGRASALSSIEGDRRATTEGEEGGSGGHSARVHDCLAEVGEMYLPPLTSTLLTSIYKEKAAVHASVACIGAGSVSLAPEVVPPPLTVQTTLTDAAAQTLRRDEPSVNG